MRSPSSIFIAIAVALLLLLTSCLRPITATGTEGSSGTNSTAMQTTSSSYQVVAYFPQWAADNNFFAKELANNGSASKITVLNYAFGNIVDGHCIMTTEDRVMDAYSDYQRLFSADESVDGVADTNDQPLRGNFNQLKKLKAVNPNLRIVISLGGWTWSKGFSDAALTPESRTAVVQSCIDIYIKGNLPVVDQAGGEGAAAGVFDGIDIDWEYPATPADVGHVYRPEDTPNYTLLLAEFRRQLDEIDPNLLLTVATPAAPSTYSHYELDKIHPYLNWINLMSYDLHGTWESTTNFHSHLHPANGDNSKLSVQEAVEGYIAAGVPAKKLVMGVPFYGIGWEGVSNQNHGLYQSATGPAPSSGAPGSETYRVLKTLAYPSFRDPVTGGFWIYDGDVFWSYDDPQVLTEKMAWLKEQGLGGAMIWSIDQDDEEGTLLNAISEGLASGSIFLPVITKAETSG